MNSNLALGAFLPLSRMGQLAASAHDSYVNAQPFPHAVCDDFFDPALLEQVLSEFPAPGEIPWHRFDNEREIKLASAAESTFGPITRIFLYHLNSITFLEFLSRLTGVPDLISDPSFGGGGLHQIVRGGRLGIHADFNRHTRFGLDRRLNLLIYLNRDWREEYGGYLELWSRDMTHCEAKILPVFNRVVIFSTTDFAYHGHPDPLACPEGMARKSLALYYYTNGRPADEVSGTHTTLFRPRTQDDFRLTPRQRVRRVAAAVLPPILMRRLERYF